MTFRWFGRANREHTTSGLAPVARDAGWVLGNRKELAGSACGAYAGQLIEEGYAEWVGDDCLIPWRSLYRVLDAAEHTASFHLLALPPPAPLRPHLVSAGSPGDADFRIRLDHWVSDAGPLPASAVSRTGAFVRWRERDGYLPEAAFELLAQLNELSARGREWTPDARMLAAGRIQATARACRASFDGYLAKTEVVAPETLDMELVAEQIADVPIVEVVPRPDGVPDRWLEQFDGYDRVRVRYDIPHADGGLTHVTLPEPVREVLESIKRVPGRRYASRDADAFLHNPYPFLGEHGEAALPPERFERARKAAGIVERELDARQSAAGWDLVFTDPGGDADDVFEALAEPKMGHRLLAEAAEARRAGLPTFRWKSHRVLLSGSTGAGLQAIGQWLAGTAAARMALQVAEVFDLAAYSDRVVGFDGKPIHVPFLGRKDASREWVPDNIQLTVATACPGTGEASTAVLEAGKIEEWREAIQNATTQGTPTVALPGTPFEIPVQEARTWLDGIGDALGRKPGLPQVSKVPRPRPTPSLRILHNIEQVDYGAQAALACPPLEEPVMPGALRAGIKLKRHQQAGLAWMQHRYAQREQGLRGILLADDMGLGKTLQCLCLIAWYRATQPDPKPCLVVAPVSLLENWKAEIDKFLDGSQGATIELYGHELARHRLAVSELAGEFTELGLKKFLRPGFAGDAAIVLTTYETLRDYELSLGREAWGILVCDEAQKIKTPGALVTRSAKAMQSDFKIACTGTPVENSLADLWCLFDFFQPALLGSLSEFTKKFRKAIELREEGHEAQVEHLRAAIEPWVLRRMKTEVAELPPKIDELHPQADPKSRAIPMSPLQRKLYGEAVAGFKQAMAKADDGDQIGTMTLTLLHRLRMICADPLGVAHDNAETLAPGDHLRHSPKLRWLMDQLEHIQRRGEKVIVFTEYREIQRLLQRTIAEGFDIEVDIVNGSTSVDTTKDASRQKLIDRFQQRPGFGVIVLSTTAVGFGVNVQQANHVIHFTRSWNPAKEDQATDRAYRIGQEKSVWVHCPTIAGEGYESFEQRLAVRLAGKRALSRDMLAPEQSVGWTDFSDLIQ